MPLQLQRLLLAFAIVIGAMLVFKHFMTPDTWGEYGHYRGAALDEIADKEVKFVQMDDCAMCHDSIAEFKDQGEHARLQCELCHGPGYKHIEDETNQLTIPEGRGLCLRCHEMNPARPKDVIKQIVDADHNADEDCITCHNPHSPWQ